MILFAEESYQIMGACFEVYKIKGSGFLEPIYKSAWRSSSIYEDPFTPQPSFTIT